MILNTRVGGGLKEEDINAELLQSLDPDFTAENIAEGVDLFGLVGALSSSKAAYGTATAQGSTGSTSTNGESYVQVSGLSFKPDHVILIRTGLGKNYILSVMPNGSGLYYSGSGGGWNASSKTVTVTLNDDGFKVATTASSSVQGYFYGNHYWVAWTD